MGCYQESLFGQTGNRLRIFTYLGRQRYRLAEHCPDLKELCIIYEDKYYIEIDHEDDIESDVDVNLNYWFSLCSKLKVIELHGFDLSLDQCVCLSACGQLESITYSSSETLSALHIAILLKGMTMLKSLEIKECDCDAEVLSQLGANCPLLEHLDIECVVEILAMHIEVFTQGWTKLKMLEFEHLDGDDGMVYPKDD